MPQFILTRFLRFDLAGNDNPLLAGVSVSLFQQPLLVFLEFLELLRLLVLLEFLELLRLLVLLEFLELLRLLAILKSTGVGKSSIFQ